MDFGVPKLKTTEARTYYIVNFSLIPAFWKTSIRLELQHLNYGHGLRISTLIFLVFQYFIPFQNLGRFNIKIFQLFNNTTIKSFSIVNLHGEYQYHYFAVFAVRTKL